MLLDVNTINIIKAAKKYACMIYHTIYGMSVVQFYLLSYYQEEATQLPHLITLDM